LWLLDLFIFCPLFLLIYELIYEAINKQYPLWLKTPTEKNIQLSHCCQKTYKTFSLVGAELNDIMMAEDLAGDS